MKASAPKHIVLGVTGSIAAYKAADLIRAWKAKGARVSVIMTHQAEQFITPLTLASLSGGRVYRDLFDVTDDGEKMPHIFLAREADAIVVAPATAHVIGKMASGLADDLLTNVILATEAPVVVAPAMNHVMYRNAIVQENCRKLKSMGFHWIEPCEGKLACGEYGVGHFADVEEIVAAVEKILKITASKKKAK